MTFKAIANIILNSVRNIILPICPTEPKNLEDIKLILIIPPEVHRHLKINTHKFDNFKVAEL